MSASGESSTTMHRLLHASGSHPIPTPYDPKVSGSTSEDGDDDQDIERPKICKTGKHCNRIALHIALPLGLDPGPWLATTDRIALAIDHPNESRIQYLCDPQWFRDTASRGPTTIVAPESQFRTCPTNHDHIGKSRNQYNQDLGLIHSTNGNNLESPNEGSSIDHQEFSELAGCSIGSVQIAVRSNLLVDPSSNGRRGDIRY
ncbi:hypothetical protein F511_16842 [Dorcoceras hygrometricum]|uniref:Uncharacterized protein n=1 Tax=Dorcoceras hygrometricum TaxID=472368 RepID=A0A2Z7APU8_9LAMI|nr:hypothetical protein F511_16842 [Dorcoceras hygrometricum]